MEYGATDDLRERPAANQVDTGRDIEPRDTEQDECGDEHDEGNGKHDVPPGMVSNGGYRLFGIKGLQGFVVSAGRDCASLSCGGVIYETESFHRLFH
jgi:hypothetical protein